MGKEQELLERDQTVAVLREEVMAMSAVTSITSIRLAMKANGGHCMRCIFSALQSGMRGHMLAVLLCDYLRRHGCWMQLDLEKKLRTLLTKEKEKAEEEAALAMGLCTGGPIF